jgi:hypothetical protein
MSQKFFGRSDQQTIVEVRDELYPCLVKNTHKRGQDRGENPGG